MIEDDAPDVDEVVEVAPPIVEVLSSPSSKADKGKGIFVSGLSGPAKEPCDDGGGATVCALPSKAFNTQHYYLNFVPRRDESSLEGLNPRFYPDMLAMARLEGREIEFSWMGVDPQRVFNPVPNIMNSELILFDESDVGSSMIDAMTLPRDRHVMYHSKGKTLEFTERFWESLTLVSHLT